MEKAKVKDIDIEGIIAKNNDEIEQEKEQKLVNLIIEIIVSSTLKEYYEKSDQVFKI